MLIFPNVVVANSHPLATSALLLNAVGMIDRGEMKVSAGGDNYPLPDSRSQRATTWSGLRLIG